METFLRKLIENHTPMIQNQTELILAMLAISPTTTLHLKGAIANLQKSAKKDRDSILTKNLEIDYLVNYMDAFFFYCPKSSSFGIFFLNWTGNHYSHCINNV